MEDQYVKYICPLDVFFIDIDNIAEPDIKAQDFKIEGLFWTHYGASIMMVNMEPEPKAVAFDINIATQEPNENSPPWVKKVKFIHVHGVPLFMLRNIIIMNPQTNISALSIPTLYSIKGYVCLVTGGGSGM